MIAPTPLRGAPAPLVARGVSVAYGGALAVEEVSAEFPAGAMTAIVGPNGAGKSSFLKALVGVVPMLAGEARFFGGPFRAARARVAYVPQRASVDWEFPARAVDVAMMGLYPRMGLFRLTGRAERRAALDALDRVGMLDFADRQIGRLSGGQQQRVFLARALAQGADLYLLDEPFAGVDAATERAVVDLLRDLRDEGRAVVCVHHDLSTLAEYFDRALLMNRTRFAEGPVAQAVTPATLHAAYGGRIGAASGAALAV
jgi:manganese/zinc/iron transport system ATP- binding protein